MSHLSGLARLIALSLLSGAVVSLAAAADEAAAPEVTGAKRVLYRVGFDDFSKVDWGIGHDVWLPRLNPADKRTQGSPRNDGGDWVPLYWERSDQGRHGQCLELRIVQPNTSIRGCAVNFSFQGENAFPPDREITVSVWTNSTRAADDDFTNFGIGWHPNDYAGGIGGAQDYQEFSLRKDEGGWAQETLTFRSHADPEIGDSIGLVFGARTKAPAEFRLGEPSALSPGVRPVLAVQPTLSAFFDDMTISVAEPE